MPFPTLFVDHQRHLLPTVFPFLFFVLQKLQRMTVLKTSILTFQTSTQKSALLSFNPINDIECLHFFDGGHLWQRCLPFIHNPDIPLSFCSNELNSQEDLWLKLHRKQARYWTPLDPWLVLTSANTFCHLYYVSLDLPFFSRPKRWHNWSPTILWGLSIDNNPNQQQTKANIPSIHWALLHFYLNSSGWPSSKHRLRERLWVSAGKRQVEMMNSVVHWRMVRRQVGRPFRDICFVIKKMTPEY